MPAYATQSAPKQAQGNPQQQKQPKQEAPKGLAALPQGAGVAALVVMLALALPIGNFRALQNATPQAFIRQGDVKSIVEDRISAAQNAVTVAQRGSVSQTTLDDVSSAIKAMQSAKTARDISRADQQLTVAVSQLVDDANLTSAEDERMLTRAADTFAEQGSFLRQEARSYNQKAEKAEKPAAMPQQDKYQKILDELHRVNDAIPDEEMTDKISRLEAVSAKIFEQARTDPDKLPQMRKFMDYYLPTSLKLLNTYAELDKQGIEGENISESKHRIEQTMDTLEYKCWFYETAKERGTTEGIGDLPPEALPENIRAVRARLHCGDKKPE